MQPNEHPPQPSDPDDGTAPAESAAEPARGSDEKRPREPAGRARAWFVLRWLLTLLLVTVPAVVWGVTTASAEASLGPHLARYDVTVDDQVTVDLGPLGTLVIDSPLPLRLGARVVVQEIPREVTAVPEPDTLAALGEDLAGYVQFFSGPQATLDVAVRALVLDAARRAGLAVVVVGLVVWAAQAALGVRRRAELTTALRPYRGTAAGGLVLVTVVATTLTGSDPVAADRDDERHASAVFDGTPLEGARITGRLAGVIDTYGGYVVDLYRDNEDFYEAAREDLVVAWEERAAADLDLQAKRDAMALPGSTSGRGAQGSDAEDSEPTDDAAEEAGDPPEPVTLLVVSDLHCNVGMARIIREVAELSGADVVLNAGDTTINGTAVEAYCVTAFAGAVPAGATQIVADGNHDSEQTAAQERAAGATVLAGEVVEVAGVRILGDKDPNATRIGEGTRQVGQETVAEQGHRLAEVACADGEVDLLMVHNPNVGNAALEDGCVAAQVSGHMHKRIGPARYGEGVRYISTSTAGARLNQATVGPLNGVAELTILRFDPRSRSMVDYRLVRVQPSGQVSVGFAVRWPGTRTVFPAPQGAR